MKRLITFMLFLFSGCISPLIAREPVRLASSPALSPDGTTLAFSWAGDVWTVSSDGGAAKRLTGHPAEDGEPQFSPDGKRIAFTSDRSGSRQAYVTAASGGVPKQITYHSEGHSLQGWFPGGDSVLTSASRDHFWRHSQRFFRVRVEDRQAKKLLFDAAGREGHLSRDGKRLLFTREGTQWWRKGYRGSQASQVWLYDSAEKNDGETFRQLAAHPSGCRSPLWKPDGKGFYYIGGQSGAFNLWERELATEMEKQLTHFEDDSVVNPCISADGSTIVFRHLFDFYRLRPGENAQPVKLDIYVDADRAHEPIQRRTLRSASDAAFTIDGLEIAFIAGGDVWVMDTELREPRQVTDTPEEESEPVFSPDGDSIYFVSDAENQSDIWKATRGNEGEYWWQNDEFVLTRITKDSAVESDVRFSPTGKLISFVRERGDLFVMKPDGTDVRRIVPGWYAVDYDWSPDGKWFVYAVYDNDFNRDVWIAPLDGSREPYNLSRHPDNDYDPTWSPDGKTIAFTGRQFDTEVDIYFVELRKIDAESDSRSRKIKAALDKMKKTRKSSGPPKPGDKPMKEPVSADPPLKEPVSADSPEKADASKASSAKPESKPPSGSLPKVRIDFDDIHERVRRVSVPNSTEAGLVWSPDSKKLAFVATIDGKRGTYTIEPPENLSPKALSTSTVSSARWIKQGNQIVGTINNVPGVLAPSGPSYRTVSYGFTALQTLDVPAKHAAVFDQCWRIMRDRYYDGSLNNRNWNAFRRKYRPLAEAAVDLPMLSRVVSLMLGELNGSHLGFRAAASRPASASSAWQETTAHLGLRFAGDFKGPGWKVKDVIADGPADKEKSRIEPGEIVLSVDGVDVDPALDPAAVLNGPLSRDIHLKIKNAKGAVRDVQLRPISYSAARSRLYDAWVEHNRESVEKASGGKLGYAHVRAMNMSSFYQFERDLYAAAAGKDGLVIDVRENGGGFTTDHLLTILTQPAHAVTKPRGGGRGYPQDRLVYARWGKPVVVLCNQNSFSNAEIFSHAIKTLGRGQLVGVPTAGAVISTGAARVMDVGMIRVPFRGWYVLETGEDMELNGAVPHHVLWPQPGQWPAGKDVQLEKAIDVLKQEVAEWNKRPQVELTKASERKGDEAAGK